MTQETPKPALHPVDDETIRSPLAECIAQHLGAQKVVLTKLEKLSGGAIQENWAIEAEVHGGPHDGAQQWVLRTDAPSGIRISLDRQQEFAVLSMAFRAGVRVPEPLFALDGSNPLGRPFFLMRRLAGVAAGYRLTRDTELVPDPRRLASELGVALARLHSIKPASGELAFLSRPESVPALQAIAEYRAFLDTLSESQPVLEWGLRWCEKRASPDYDIRLIHRDFRTGNYLVADGGLSGVLDWEFAAFGDPREDIGWFSARCWRFAKPSLEAGGIGEIDDFLAAYSNESGRSISRDELVYWQVMAHLRWAIIALQQAQRHLSGKEVSLELALTGRIVPELELGILDLIEGAP